LTSIWDSGRYNIVRLVFSKRRVSEQCQRNLLLCSSSVQTILMPNTVTPSPCLSACPFSSDQTVPFTWMVVMVTFISSTQCGLENTDQDGWNTERLHHTWDIFCGLIIVLDTGNIDGLNIFLRVVCFCLVPVVTQPQWTIPYKSEAFRCQDTSIFNLLKWNSFTSDEC
jgi:hypothetical protein